MKTIINYISLFCIFFIALIKAYTQELNSDSQSKALNGEVEAQYEMGKTYLDSLYNQPLFSNKSSNQKLEDEAKKWFLLATKQGHVKSRYYLSRMQEPNYDCPIDCLEKAAQEGIADAQYSIAFSILDKSKSEPKDLALACKWLFLSQYGHGKDSYFNYNPKLFHISDLINFYKISHLDLGKGQKLADEHIKKYGPSSCLFNH